MDEAFFEHWEGAEYETSRTLLISESAYDWVVDGDIYTPESTHPTDSIQWNIEHFGKNQYFTKLNRALCGKRAPSEDEMKQAWSRFAYTIYVQRSVGRGPGVRPSNDLWKDAEEHFLTLIEKIRPNKIIVTGVDMWNRMPECYCRLLDDLQAYKLHDGTLCWCLALPHPANRRDGFKWERIGESVKLFLASELPAVFAS